ncbi:hypothetical protein ACIHFD_36440 [Nonomuraea sp. NPDC051941]|uniref:hypothetical protein n=1 Tax=Nonomuraea sp. NPDC051941 TaxID=3364373 RepID=UPI0037CC292B
MPASAAGPKGASSLEWKYRKNVLREISAACFYPGNVVTNFASDTTGPCRVGTHQGARGQHGRFRMAPSRVWVRVVVQATS